MIIQNTTNVSHSYQVRPRGVALSSKTVIVKQTNAELVITDTTDMIWKTGNQVPISSAPEGMGR
jgi:hypothetical protein